MILIEAAQVFGWSFGWPLIPALIAAAVAFVAQTRLRGEIDRDKFRQLDDPSIYFHRGLPPRQILTEKGQRLLRIVHVGGGIFSGCIILMMLLSLWH